MPAWLALALATLLALLPFVGKAFHVDDPLFVWAGDQIRAAPLDPFGFRVNWRGFEEPMAAVTKNPPLACYYVAAVRALFGESEAALHLAFALPAMGVVLGTHALARRLCGRPGLAALLVLFSPVFLVSATTVMCDVTMLALWMAALCLFERGLREERSAWLLGASVLVALATLTKYFAIALVPLAFAYALLRTRRLGPWAPALLVPLVVLPAYELLTFRAYGQGLFAEAVSFAATQRASDGLHVAQGLPALVFAGGGLASALCFAPRLWSRPVLAGGGALAIVAAFAFARRVEPEIALQQGVFAVAGASVLGLAALDALRTRTPEAWMLASWVGGTFAFTAFVNWSVNGRSLLPMAPAVAILLVRRLEARADLRLDWRTLAPASLCAALAFAAAFADYRLAGVDRSAALAIARRHLDAPGALWSQGSWGFAYYLERAGARRVDVRRSHLRAGDRVATPAAAADRVGLRSGRAQAIRLDRFALQPSRFVATMDAAVGAGFYASYFARRRGPLPFAFGAVPSRVYEVVRLTRPVKLAPRRPASG